MARARKKSNPVKETVEAILKKQNINYNDWEKDIINKKKLEVMADEDKEWTAEIVNEASMAVIMEEVVKQNKKAESTHSSNVSKPEFAAANAN